MKKYVVYITKSEEVVYRLVQTFKPGDGGVECVSCGYADSSTGTAEELIPAVYRQKDLFYCAVTYSEDADEPPYRLVIA